MNCPKCGNSLREDMFCENCKEYLFNMDKPKKGDTAKSWLKVFGITLGCCAIFVCIIVGVIEIGEKREYQKEITAQYEKIYQEYSDKDYYSALSDIKNLRNTYADNKKMLVKISNLSNDIELELYEDIKSADIAISDCNTYLEFYPNGKYVEEVNKLLITFSEKQAIQDINKAKVAISKNDVLEADSILQSIIDNTNVSENTKKDAREVLKPIADKVTAEKGKKAILGTWKKETGVIYTFEENGHMSVSMSSNYDSSAGTALDGREVISLLSEIEDFSRIVRGGSWEYVGTQKSDSTTVYVYRLFYYSSDYTCIIGTESGNKMGIYLSSGIGDMSILWK